MPLFDKLKRLLSRKPATSDYRFDIDRPFRRPRDLPTFSFETIYQMLLDPTIRLGLKMRTAPLTQAEFAFPRTAADGKVEWIPGVEADDPAVGAFVHRQLKRIWKLHLRKLLKAQIWGWSGCEVTYRMVDGLAEVDRFLHRHALHTYALMKDGEIWGVQFRNLGSGIGQANLEFPRACWHAYMPESERPYGWSVLEGAHSPWADKWLDGGGLDVRRLFMHKDAYGGVDIAYPHGTTRLELTSGTTTAVPNRDIAREIAEQAKSGSVTWRPSDFDANGKEKWTVTRATVPSNPGHILQYPKDLDVEMLRGMEIPDDVLTSEAGGAWQGKQVPMLAFFTSSDEWMADVVASVVIQVLEPLVLMNWGRAESFNVQTKPLALQAMEQIQTTSEPSAPAENTQAEPQQQVVTPGFNGQRFALPDELVGAGLLQASDLVNGQAHRFNGHRNRFSTGEIARIVGLNRDETQLLERIRDAA